jgi:hypothetical protein
MEGGSGCGRPAAWGAPMRSTRKPVGAAQKGTVPPTWPRASCVRAPVWLAWGFANEIYRGACVGVVSVPAAPPTA